MSLIVLISGGIATGKSTVTDTEIALNPEFMRLDRDHLPSLKTHPVFEPPAELEYEAQQEWKDDYYIGLIKTGLSNANHTCIINGDWLPRLQRHAFLSKMKELLGDKHSVCIVTFKGVTEANTHDLSEVDKVVETRFARMQSRRAKRDLDQDFYKSLENFTKYCKDRDILDKNALKIALDSLKAKHYEVDNTANLPLASISINEESTTILDLKNPAANAMMKGLDDFINNVPKKLSRFVPGNTNRKRSASGDANFLLTSKNDSAGELDSQGEMHLHPRLVLQRCKSDPSFRTTPESDDLVWGIKAQAVIDRSIVRKRTASVSSSESIGAGTATSAYAQESPEVGLSDNLVDFITPPLVPKLPTLEWNKFSPLANDAGKVHNSPSLNVYENHRVVRTSPSLTAYDNMQRNSPSLSKLGLLGALEEARSANSSPRVVKSEASAQRDESETKRQKKTPVPCEG